jgi:hypothetical protein
VTIYPSHSYREVDVSRWHPAHTGSCIAAGGSARGVAAMGGRQFWRCVDVERMEVPRRVRSEVLACLRYDSAALLKSE